MRNINEPNRAKDTLRMLARRLRETNKCIVRASPCRPRKHNILLTRTKLSFQTAVKTLIVWHRCLRTGDDAFTRLCAEYQAILNIPNFSDPDSAPGPLHPSIVFSLAILSQGLSCLFEQNVTRVLVVVAPL